MDLSILNIPKQIKVDFYCFLFSNYAEIVRSTTQNTGKRTRDSFFILGTLRFHLIPATSLRNNRNPGFRYVLSET